MEYIVMVLLAFSILYTVFSFVEIKTVRIRLNDINVGDRLRIKGERFIVKNYSSNGNVEIEKLGKNDEKYVINIKPDNILISHNEDGKRDYISIEDFEGTVGGDYLNKIKFN